MSTDKLGYGLIGVFFLTMVVGLFQWNTFWSEVPETIVKIPYDIEVSEENKETTIAEPTATGNTVSEKAEEEIEKVIYHKRFPIDSIKQQYVQYAYEISGWDIVFVGMLQAENDAWDPHRQSEVIDHSSENGKEDSWWFCQVHRPSHPHVVNHEFFWTDWRWQMRTCYELYTRGVYFAGKRDARGMLQFFGMRKIS